MGSNRGIQIRKIYEPEYFPEAHSVRFYDKYLGTQRRKHVCSFGFEPNPHHKSELKRLELAYQAMGWRARFFHVAASNKKGKVKFKQDVTKGLQNAEWGARVLDPNDKSPLPQHLFSEKDPTVNVPAIDFSEWFEREIVGREIPPGPGKPTIFAKTDMEFHDNHVWSRLVQRGLICHISAIYGEHAEELEEALKYLRKYTNCTTTYLGQDDETYGLSTFPLPKPKKKKKRKVKKVIEEDGEQGESN